MQRLINRIIQMFRRWSRSRKYMDVILGDQDLSELAKGSGIAFAFKILSLPLGLTTSLIISRRYGAEAMGLYGLMTTVMGIVVSVGMLGLGSAMPRFLGEARAKQTGDEQAIYRTSVRMLVVSGLILSPLLYFVAPWLSEVVFSEPRLLFPLQVASLFLLPMILGGYNLSYLLAAKKVYWSELISGAIGPVFMFLFVFGSYWFWPTYYIPIWGWLLGSLITLGVSLYILWKEKFMAIRGNLFGWRKLMGVSGPMVIAGLSLMIMQYTDIFMLGSLSTVYDVGIYKVIAGLSYLVLLPYALISAIWEPKLSELYRAQKKQELIKSINVFGKVISRVSIIITLAFVLVGKYILALYGTEFVAGYYALMLLVINQAINTMTASNGLYMNISGKEKILRNSLLVAGLLNILLNSYLIPLYGLTGGALSTSASLLCFNVRGVRYIWRRDRVHTFIL